MTDLLGAVLHDMPITDQSAQQCLYGLYLIKFQSETSCLFFLFPFNYFFLIKKIENYSFTELMYILNYFAEK